MSAWASSQRAASAKITSTHMPITMKLQIGNDERNTACAITLPPTTTMPAQRDHGLPLTRPQPTASSAMPQIPTIHPHAVKSNSRSSSSFAT